MIPYFPQPTLPLAGPLAIHAYGVMVASAILLGSWLAGRRIERSGLSREAGAGISLYAVVSGLAFAHWVSVLAYTPRQALEDPLSLLRVWESLSSFGGFFGGLLGIWLFFLRGRPRIAREDRIRYLDAVSFAFFPFAWTVGRLGCALAHDHPGRITTFPLGIRIGTPEAVSYITAKYAEAGMRAALPPPSSLAGMAFHDLGWYEFLYCLLVAVPLFLGLDRKARPPGFFPALFLLTYAPVRFGLDFLRIADPRHFGLTPGQFFCVPAFLGGAVLLRGVRRKRRG